MSKFSGTTQDSPEDCSFNLHEFFPYQTRIFYRHVSDAVSEIYVSRYDMKPNEWRTLAILGDRNSYTPAEIVELSSMDKVAVSRALASMTARGWLIGRANKKDGRSRIIRASAQGRRVYRDLLPAMREVEQRLLSKLDEGEVEELRRLMAKVIDTDLDAPPH